MTWPVKEAYCIELLLHEVQVLALELQWRLNEVRLCENLEQFDSFLVFLLLVARVFLVDLSDLFLDDGFCRHRVECAVSSML